MLVYKIFFNYAQQELEKDQFSILNAIADNKVNLIKFYFDEREKDLRELQDDGFIISNILKLRPVGSKQDQKSLTAHRLIDRKLRTFTRITGFQDIMLLAPDGKILYGIDPAHYRDEAEQNPYLHKKIVLKDRPGIYISPVYNDKQEGHGRELFICGSLHKAGKFIGTILFELNMRHFYKLIQGTNGLGRSGETVLAKPERDRALVLNPLRHDPQAALKRVIMFNQINGRPIQRAVQGYSGSGMALDYRQYPIICAWRYLPEQHWGMVVKIDQSEAFAPIAKFKKFTAGLIAFALFAIAVASVFISRKLIIPLESLRNGAQRITAGDLDFRVEHKSRDEIGQLAVSFNTMAESLAESSREMDEKVAARTIELEGLNREYRVLSSAVQQSPVAVIITDNNWNIEYVNPTFTKMTGYSVVEIKNKDLGVAEKEDASLFDKEMRKTVMAGGTWQGELQNTSKNGRLFWVKKIVFPVINQDGIISHFITIKEEITDRKETEDRLNDQLVELNDMRRAMLNMLEDLENSNMQAQAASRAKTDFLANMSHEIRTPMNAIIGMTYLTMQTDLTLQQRDYLKKINISSQSLLEIINNILDLSKIEAGRMELEQTEFNINDLMDKIVIQSAENIAAKGVELLLDIDPDIPAVLIGDPMRLGQVLNNLLANAAKFTNQGEIEVSAHILSLNSQLVLELAVADTGIGISEEDLAGIFKKFTQADTSTTRRYGGSGLGLAICQQLVEMMGGTLSLESVYGEGSKFSFTLPLGYQADSIRQEAKYLPLNLRSLKVLVVDGHKKTRDRMRDSLTSLGLQVTSVPNCRAAYEIMQTAAHHKVPFELLVIDFKRVKDDKFKIAAKRQASTQLAQIPIVIIASLTDLVMAEELAAKTPMARVIPKPLTTLALIHTIATIFGYVDEETEKSAADNYQNIDLNGASVLLVEDSVFNQQVAGEVMKQIGIEVEIANNGREAVDAVKKKHFDLILMDIQMPVMDGLSAARAIRNLGGDFSKLPIVAMSANAMVSDRKKSLTAGMNDHINKPFEPDELYACLGHWLEAGGWRTSENGGRAEREIVELPVLDIERGIKRVGNKRELYFSLLRDFVRDYSSFEAKSREAAAAEDYETLRRLTHTVKGIAGTIGAVKLQKKAAKLEKAIVNRVRNLSGRLREVGGEIQRLKKMIMMSHSAVNSHLPSMETRETAAVGSAIFVELEKLNKLLTMNSTTANQLFDSLKDKMVTDWPRETSEIDKALSRFDFNAARERLKIIMDSSFTTLKGPADAGKSQNTDC